MPPPTRPSWTSRRRPWGSRRRSPAACEASANVTAAPTEVDATTTQTIGQQISFPVTAGQTYTFTKFVGIDDSQDTTTPVAAAQAEAAAAALNGYDAALTANQTAWSALWNGRVDVLGNNTVATDVNASEFYLWSNTARRRGLERLPRRVVLQRL